MSEDNIISKGLSNLRLQEKQNAFMLIITKLHEDNHKIKLRM